MLKMIKNIPKIITIQENPNWENYKFVDVDSQILKKLYEDIENLNILEKQNEIITCFRGAKKSKEFYDNYLYKLFIVGEKSNYFIGKAKDQYLHYVSDNMDKPKLLTNIFLLVSETNKILASKSKKKSSDCIKGNIPDSFIISLQEMSILDLRRLQVFFISFLHNNGHKDFKEQSPFISLTYGKNKLKIAKKFACFKNENDENLSLIYVYSLNINNDQKYFITAEHIKNILQNHKVTWYDDNNKEILLLNGIYPHYLLGFFQIKNDQIISFVINPWLYLEYINNKNFDHVNGINVNQDNFIKYASTMYKYQSYFFMDDPTRKFVCKIGEIHEGKSIIETQ